MKHHSAADVAAFREDLPGNWLVEVDVGDAALLISIPATEENANRILAGSPGMTPDMLDGLTVRSGRIQGGPDGQALHDR